MHFRRNPTAARPVGTCRVHGQWISHGTQLNSYPSSGKTMGFYTSEVTPPITYLPLPWRQMRQGNHGTIIAGNDIYPWHSTPRALYAPQIFVYHCIHEKNVSGARSMAGRWAHKVHRLLQKSVNKLATKNPPRYPQGLHVLQTAHGCQWLDPCGKMHISSTDLLNPKSNLAKSIAAYIDAENKYTLATYGDLSNNAPLRQVNLVYPSFAYRFAI